MTKICHMTSAHPPEDGRIFLKECVSLARAGYQVYLVEQGESCEKEGVHIVGVGAPGGGRMERMTKFARKVYDTALALDAELYHIHDPELLPYALKLKRLGKKVVFDSHELYALQLRQKPYLPVWVTVPMAKCYCVLEEYVLRRIDGLVFPCLYDGKNPFEGKCRHVSIVNNVPRLDEMYETWQPHERTEFAACYVGDIRPDRGITQDVLACQQEGVILELGGAFSPPEYVDTVRSLDERGLVRIHGRLNRQQVCALLRGASVGFVTQLNVGQQNILDNMPTKAYEYMASGLPVIISRSKYVEDLLALYPFGISVNPEDTEQIAAAIAFLRDHPEQAWEMGRIGRKAVFEEFNWGVEEQKLFKLYGDILKEKS